MLQKPLPINVFKPLAILLSAPAIVEPDNEVFLSPPNTIDFKLIAVLQ